MTDSIEQLRAMVAAVSPEPSALTPYLDKVRDRAYTVTDADVEALKVAGVSGEEIFEHTVTAAVAEGLRLDAGLEVIG